MKLQTTTFTGRAVRRSPRRTTFASFPSALDDSVFLQAVVAGVISLIPAALLGPFVSGPIMNDEGIFATLARELLNGGLPYRDLFEVTPPGTYSLYALGFLIFGEEAWVPHVLLIGVLCATTSIVFIEARLLFSVRAAVCASLAFAMSTGIALLGSMAIDDYFVLLPISASYVAFTLAVQHRSPAWFFAAGVLCGLTAITNQTALVHFLFLMGASAKTAWSPSRTFPLKTLLFPLAGISLVFFIVAVPYLISGSFDDLWYGAVMYPLFYAGSNSILDRILYGGFAALWFAIAAAPLVLLACVGAKNLLRTQPSLERTIALGWIASALLALAVTGRFYHYYFVGLLPPLALLAGVALAQPATDMQVHKLRKVAFLSSVYVAFALSAFLNAQAYTQPTQAGKLIARVSSWQIRDVQSPDVARYLASRTSPDQKILNLGHQAELYFYTDRRPGSRFFHDFPLKDNPRNVKKLLADLDKNKPVYIVDSLKPQSLEDETVKYIPEVGRYIQANYVFETRIEFDPKLLSIWEQALEKPNGRDDLKYYADIYRLKEKEPAE